MPLESGPTKISRTSRGSSGNLSGSTGRPKSIETGRYGPCLSRVNGMLADFSPARVPVRPPPADAVSLLLHTARRDRYDLPNAATVLLIELPLSSALLA